MVLDACKIRKNRKEKKTDKVHTRIKDLLGLFVWGGICTSILADRAVASAQFVRLDGV